MQICFFLVLFCTLSNMYVNAQVSTSTGATITTPTGATVYSFLTGVTTGTSGSITFSRTTIVDVLIVGSGGAGGGNRGGGGGGGGMICATGVSVPAGSYSVTVGYGGVPNTANPTVIRGGTGSSSYVLPAEAVDGTGEPIWQIYERSSGHVIEEILAADQQAAWAEAQGYLQDIGAEDPSLFSVRPKMEA